MKTIRNYLVLTAGVVGLSLAGVLPSRASDLWVDNVTIYSNTVFYGPITSDARVNGVLRVDNLLSIGMSNATPIYALDVLTTTADTVARFRSTSSNYSGVVFDTVSSTADPEFTFRRVGSNKATLGVSHADDSFYVGTGIGHVFRISAVGEVTSYGYDMYRGVSLDSGTLNLGAVTDYQGKIHYNAQGDTVFYFDNTWDSANALTKFRMRTAGTPVDVLTLKGNGRVGIGLGAPTEALDVVGNGKFSGNLSAANFSGSSSGSNTGDETLATIKTKLGPASSGVDGYLKGSDWTAFNSKVSSPWVISGANLSYSAGGVSVGSSSPAPGALYVSKNFTGGSLWGIYDALNTAAAYTGTTGSINIGGSRSTVTVNPSADVYDLAIYGQVGQLNCNGSHNIDATDLFPLRATYSRVALDGTGTIKGVAAFDTFMGFENGSTPLGYVANYVARSPYRAAGTGTIGTMYGVYLESQKQSFVSDAYGIYQTGANDKNYFNGKVGIGTSSPRGKLDVVGGFDDDGYGNPILLDTSGAVLIGDYSQQTSGSLLRIQGEGCTINTGYFTVNGLNGYSVIRTDGETGGVKLGSIGRGATLTVDPDFGRSLFEGCDVGIGTSEPEAKLHVADGNIKVSNGQFVGNGSGLLILPQGDLDMGTFDQGSHP